MEFSESCCWSGVQFRLNVSIESTSENEQMIVLEAKSVDVSPDHFDDQARLSATLSRYPGETKVKIRSLTAEPRHRGYGTEILQRFMRLDALRGCDVIWGAFSTQDTEEAALAEFYRSNGFDVDVAAGEFIRRPVK